MSQYGVIGSKGVWPSYGVLTDEGVRPSYGVGAGDITVSVLYSTLTSSAGSFVAGGAGVTLTFTGKDTNNVIVVGFVPVPETGVV